MAIQTTTIGAYPKPPDEGQPFTLRKTLHRFEKGEAERADVDAAVNELTTAMIGEQDEAGIDIPTDGQAGWPDLLTPFARKMAGFEIGGLLRWFDNNVYYRRPVAVGPIEWRGPTSVDAFRYASSITDRPVKAVVPGPVSFARLSIDEHYGRYDEFVLAIARVLAQEAFELEAAGARYIQIDEPELLNAPEDLDLAATAIGIIAGELRSDETETTLATYFGDAKRLGPDFFGLPVDRFGLDLISGPANRELIAELPADKKLQVGVADARNTRLEAVAELTDAIESIAQQVGVDRLWVAPSAPLEFLPREKARAKLHRLVEATQKVGA